MKEYSAWSTQDELRFIARLGTHSLVGPNAPHPVWVKRYQEAIARRWNWGDIDQKAVQAAVKKELA